MTDSEEWKDFVELVAKTVALKVEQLPDLPPLVPCGLLERFEFRKSDKNNEDWGQMESFILKSSSGEEKCLIEAALNVVRVSLCMQWKGPDACILTKQVQSMFFNRAARWSALPCLRKEPVEGYDATFLFTSHDLGINVDDFLRQLLPLWRRLTKQVRLLQIIEHRRQGISLLKNLKKFESPQESQSPVFPDPELCGSDIQEKDDMDAFSIQTEPEALEELDQQLADIQSILAADQMEDKFIL